MTTTVVPDENTPIPEGSIMLRNFSVIGGMWDYQLNELVDLSPNCNTVNRQDYTPKLKIYTKFHRMPPIILTPSIEKPDPALYPCPVFRTPERSGKDNLAMVLNIPVTGTVELWIERGVALCIQKLD